MYILATLFRVKQCEKEREKVVDVDGSYLYRKYKLLTNAGAIVARPVSLSPPIVGWVAVTDENYKSIAVSIPTVTSGIYMYVNTNMICCCYSVQM